MSPLWKCFIACVLVLQCLFLMNIYNWQPYKKKTIPTKFVGFHLTYGRVGNQLFHLITGYGIARTLKRTHYLPYEDGMIQHVEKYLKSFKKVFPRLEQTYVIAQNRTDDEVIVPFAFGSCCVYDEPLRLINLTDKYLLLNFGYGQNPSYFEKYLPDVRNILQFSEEMQRNGSEVIDPLMMDYSNSLCIHIRRTDFIERNISTDMMTAVRAANSIARKKNISRFVIFGDDKDFMRDMSQEIVEEGHWKANAALVSEFDEYTDLYAASRMCKAFLITAVTSSFGWWLAFFIPDQNNVYYLPDTRNHADKIPSKELFLKSWQQYSG